MTTIIKIHQDTETEDYTVYAVGEQSDLYDELLISDINEAADFMLEWYDAVKRLNQDVKIETQTTMPGWFFSRIED